MSGWIERQSEAGIVAPAEVTAGEMEGEIEEAMGGI